MYLPPCDDQASRVDCDAADPGRAAQSKSDRQASGRFQLGEVGASVIVFLAGIVERQCDQVEQVWFLGLLDAMRDDVLDKVGGCARDVVSLQHHFIFWTMQEAVQGFVIVGIECTSSNSAFFMIERFDHNPLLAKLGFHSLHVLDFVKRQIAYELGFSYFSQILDVIRDHTGRSGKEDHGSAIVRSLGHFPDTPNLIGRQWITCEIKVAIFAFSENAFKKQIRQSRDSVSSCFQSRDAIRELGKFCQFVILNGDVFHIPGNIRQRCCLLVSQIQLSVGIVGFYPVCDSALWTIQIGFVRFGSRTGQAFD